MSVPAWPMPIHQTKLTIANPQPTGSLTPQTPMPLRRRTPIAKSIPMVSRKPMPKPTTQKSGVFRARTIDEILSVTEANVCPGSITGHGSRFAPVAHERFCSRAAASAGLGLRTSAR